MSDKQQLVISPGSSRLPAVHRPNVPAMPVLPSGNSQWITERGRYERNALTIAASTKVIEAKTAQIAAFARMVKEREELLVALASYDDVDLRIAHKRELGRISRTAELTREHLQNQVLEINLKIEVAAANMRLAQTLPIAVRDEPSPATAAASPPSLSAAEIRKAAQMMPELDGKPEVIDALVLVLSGMLAEKKA